MVAAMAANYITRDHYKRAVKKQHKTFSVDIKKTKGVDKNLQSQDITEQKIKECDRIAEGPNRKHVATATEREHWSNTYHWKQTTAGGGDTITTPKHPDLHFAEDWHREHVRGHSHKMGEIGADPGYAWAHHG